MRFGRESLNLRMEEDGVTGGGNGLRGVGVGGARAERRSLLREAIDDDDDDDVSEDTDTEDVLLPVHPDRTPEFVV